MSLIKKRYCSTLGCKMAYAVKAIVRLLQQKFAEEEVNLTIEQFFILNILDNEKGLVLSDLAEIVGTDKSAVLRHINGLEEHHFVARSQDHEDKRRKLLLVTKRGVNILEEARKLEQGINEDLTQHIPSGKLEEHQQIIDGIYEQAVEVLD